MLHQVHVRATNGTVHDILQAHRHCMLGAPSTAKVIQNTVKTAGKRKRYGIPMCWAVVRVAAPRLTCASKPPKQTVVIMDAAVPAHQSLVFSSPQHIHALVARGWQYNEPPIESWYIGRRWW